MIAADGTLGGAIVYLCTRPCDHARDRPARNVGGTQESAR
jgi:hypothetical protein